MDAVFQEGVLSDKIILKSIFETIKWIVIWLSIASLVLEMFIQRLIFDVGDFFDVTLILMLLLFRHRLQFSKSSGLLEEKLGFYFLGKSILKIRHLEIKEISVESISTRQNRSFSEIDIHYVADKEKQCSYTFKCFMQLKQVSSLISQFSKEKSDDGIEPERGRGHHHTYSQSINFPVFFLKIQYSEMLRLKKDFRSLTMLYRSLKVNEVLYISQYYA